MNNTRLTHKLKRRRFLKTLDMHYIAYTQYKYSTYNIKVLLPDGKTAHISPHLDTWKVGFCGAPKVYKGSSKAFVKWYKNLEEEYADETNTRVDSTA